MRCPDRGYTGAMPRQAAIAAIFLAVLGVAGCGGSAHQPTAARRGDCARLIAATNVIEPALTEITGIPNSDADALHRVADALTATRDALRQVETTTAQGTTAQPRARLLSALKMLSNQLAVARHDLQTGQTQQARSQGYADAGIGIDKVNGAQTEVLAACPNSR